MKKLHLIPYGFLFRENLVAFLLYGVVFGLCGLPSHATTIVPFTNLLEVKQASEYVLMVRSLNGNKVRTVNKIKGKTPKEFTVKKYAPEGGMVWGDVELETGENYLLFLDQNFKPICLSYYVLIQKDSILVHLESGEISILGTDTRGAYNKKDLIRALKKHKIPNIAVYTPIKTHVAPSHCTFLGTGYRWQAFPISIYQSGGDACAAISTSVSTLNIEYSGIELEFKGLTSYVPQCGDNTARGMDFVNWIDQNLGSPSNTFVFYGDPCGEIPDLSGCAGTLAVGGLYGFGSHTYDGQTWFNGAYGFVIMNNGLDACICGNMGLVEIHELSHSLGIGHISSSFGQANMNPFCCSGITNLDRECLDYLYPPFVNIFVGDGFWSNPANWSLGSLPNPLTEVEIPTGKSVTLDIDAQINTLEIEIGAFVETLSGIQFEIQ